MRSHAIKTVEPGTVVLHSRADDLLSLGDSEELVKNSGLPVSTLVDFGMDHRLAKGNMHDPQNNFKLLSWWEQGNDKSN